MMYLLLYWEFFKTGLFAVGGGLATLPFLYDMATRTGCFTEAQLTDMIAVSESTPGPIGINMATYVGFITGGIPGAIIATLGLVTPSIITILIIFAFLKAFKDNKYVNGVFYGLRPASTALIAAAGVVLAKVVFWGGAIGGTGTTQTVSAGIQWKALILAVIVLVLTHLVKKTKGLHPIVWIAFSALVGIIFKF